MFQSIHSMNSPKHSMSIFKGRNITERDREIHQNTVVIQSNEVQESEQNGRITLKGSDNKKSKIRLRQDMNYIQKINKFLNPTRIYNIFDNLCINEQALKNQNHNESMLKTVFYSRFINRVETNKQYVSTFLQSNQPYVDLSYVIERFNSFGDSYFHKIANYVSQIQQFFNKSGNGQKQQKSAIESTKIQKQMQSVLKALRGKAYMIKFLPNNFLFSRQFLELVGTSIEDFSKQCLNFKCIIEDFFTPENYKYLLERNCRFFLNFIDFQNDKISLKELIQSSSSQSVYTIRDRKNHLIKVKIKTYMPNPLTFCMELGEILQCIDDYHTKEIAHEIKEREYLEDTIRNNSQILEPVLLSSNIQLEENIQNRQCGYIPKPKKRCKRADPDYEI